MLCQVGLYLSNTSFSVLYFSKDWIAHFTKPCCSSSNIFAFLIEAVQVHKVTFGCRGCPTLQSPSSRLLNFNNFNLCSSAIGVLVVSCSCYLCEGASPYWLAESVVKFSGILQVRCYTVGSWKSATMGVFTPWKLAMLQMRFPQPEI